MAKKQQKITIGVRVKLEDRRRLEMLAKREDRSLSEQIRAVVKAGLLWEDGARQADLAEFAHREVAAKENEEECNAGAV